MSPAAERSLQVFFPVTMNDHFCRLAQLFYLQDLLADLGPKLVTQRSDLLRKWCRRDPLRVLVTDFNDCRDS